jgi:hypothetical protein
MQSMALALAIVGCSDDTVPTRDGTLPDGARADAVIQDAAAPDLAPPDQAPPDQAPPDGGSGPACNSSLDLKPLALDSAWCVVYRFEHSDSLSAFNFSGSSLYSYLGGGSSFKGDVEVATIDHSSGKPGGLVPVFSFGPLSGTLYASGYLALSPKGYAAVGYTKSGTFEGEIYWGDRGIKTPKRVAGAKGNYDVIFIDDKTLLINGTGVGTAQSGQGVYLYQEGKAARLLIKDMGSYSGFLALGQAVVFAGGYFSSGNKIYGFSLSEIKAAIGGSKTLSATTDGDLMAAAGASDATALGDDLVLATTDSSYKFEALSRIPVTVSGDKLSAGTAGDLVTAGSGSSVSQLAASGALLGLYLTGTKNEMAFIKKK